jgi:glycosyltransferase involved in cell wall biosynthesis
LNLALFLCYYFPPLGGGGVQRNTKFAKYLPENGWSAFVVAAKPNPRNIIEHGLDTSLLSDIENNEDIVRCRSFEYSHLYRCLYRLRARKALVEVERIIPFLYGTYKIGWYLPALIEAEKIVRRYPIKLIYSSSPPHSVHFVARSLQKRHGLPWAADFRDPWTEVATYNPPTRMHRSLETGLERMIVTRANAILANTSTNRRNLIEKYGIDQEKVVVMPNGFDPADFSQLENNIANASRFIISCMGNFYDMGRHEAFFRAYRAFSERHSNVLLQLYGWQARQVRNSLRSILREGTWKLIEKRVDHTGAIQIMRSSAILLLNVPNERAGHWVPGKLYEYLGAGRPIMFVGPKNSDAADILRRTRSGQATGFHSDEIQRVLESYYVDWYNRFPGWDQNRAEIARFDRRLQAARLAELFNAIVK